jgi:cell division septation protein DedD
MREDYVITIFSRRDGRAKTVRLKRRDLSWALAAVALLVFVVACALGYVALQLIQERQGLQAKVAHLEQVLRNLEERAPDQRRKSVEERPKPVAEDPQVTVPSPRESTATVAEKTKSRESVKVRIESPKATSVEGDDGFRFEVRIRNLGGKPISGAMAIIATCTASVQPRFVSSPPMELAPEGIPLNARKSASFSIRNFGYMRGTFRRSFSQVESFRILIYDASWQLVSDTIIPIAQVEASGLSSVEPS